jgi:hypothetical protein
MSPEGLAQDALTLRSYKSPRRASILERSTNADITVAPMLTNPAAKARSIAHVRCSLVVESSENPWGGDDD